MEGIQKLPECIGSVLGPLVRTKHQPIGGVSLFISFAKGCNHQFCIGIGTDVPGNNFSGIQIHYNAWAMPFPIGFDTGDVADPGKVRGLLREILLQMAAAIGVLRRPGRNAGLVRGHLGQL